MFKMKKVFRVIRSTEAQLIDGEWTVVYGAQYRHLGRWFNVKRPEIYTSDSPVDTHTYTEVRHVPAMFRNVEDARSYCIKLFNPPKITHEDWDVVNEFYV